MKKILLVGNGINLNIDVEEYSTLLSSRIESFYNIIGFDAVYNGGTSLGIITFGTDDEIINPKSKKTINHIKSFDKFKRWLNGPINDPKQKKIFEYYLNVSDEKIHLDLETMAQLYITSKRYSTNISKNETNLFTWLEELKDDISKEIDLLSHEDILNKDEVKRINENYDIIFTTNYDLNLENAGVNNVHHIHGVVSEKDTIELVTFKTSKKFQELMQEKIGEDDFSLDTYGINLFNEIHIINVLYQYSVKKQLSSINQYIYSAALWDNSRFGRYVSLFFFNVEPGESIPIGSYMMKLDISNNDLSVNHGQDGLAVGFNSALLRHRFSKYTGNSLKLLQSIFDMINCIHYHDHSKHIAFESRRLKIPDVVVPIF